MFNEQYNPYKMNKFNVIKDKSYSDIKGLSRMKKY